MCWERAQQHRVLDERSRYTLYLLLMCTEMVVFLCFIQFEMVDTGKQANESHIFVFFFHRGPEGLPSKVVVIVVVLYVIASDEIYLHKLLAGIYVWMYAYIHNSHIIQPYFFPSLFYTESQLNIYSESCTFECMCARERCSFVSLNYQWK